MPCYHPIDAWQNATGTLQLGKEIPDSTRLRLPCGGCLGCRTSTAQMWALRCHLELQEHQHAVFTTLTYSDENLPLTLSKPDLQAFLKRLRKRKAARAVRFFAAGEYGETTNRPHYHAILFGLAEDESRLVQDAWQKGYTTTTNITPRRIAYTAGYCQKKIGWRANEKEERVDYRTGEVYTYQPPFRQMSRNPGIAADARKYTDSWRDHAIINGQPVPVPQYLHSAWKKLATDDDIQTLAMERAQQQIKKDTSTARLNAGEKIAEARQAIRAATRHY